VDEKQKQKISKIFLMIFSTFFCKVINKEKQKDMIKEKSQHKPE